MNDRLKSELTAPALMLTGAASMYLGAALAVSLFDTLSPTAVAWLRIVGAALVLLAFVRPRRTAWLPARLMLAGTFGLITLAMNVAFYEAIARLPLGTTVALEFLGPVVVAAIGSRTVRDFLALGLATVGVVFIADVHWSGSPWGVALALTAAACWAGYIVLGKRVADRGSGMEDLTTGFVVAAVATAPLAWMLAPAFEPEAATVTLISLGLALGVLSTAVPYALDQVILKRVGQAGFAILLALLPVSASLIGFIVLGEVPKVLEAIGIVMVAVAVGVRSTRGPERPIAG